MLVLHPVILLNQLISPNRFLVESLKFSLYKIISAADKGNITSSFLIWKPFISLSYLIVPARPFSSMFTRAVRMETLVLLQMLQQKLSTFSLSMMVDLSCMAFIILMYVPSIPNLLRVFYHEGYILSNAFAASIEMIP